MHTDRWSFGVAGENNRKLQINMAHLSDKHKALITLVILTLCCINALQFFMITQTWGSIALVLYLFLLFLLFKPTHFLHPNTFIFGFYGLWLVSPAVIDLIFYLSDWKYILPWGRLWAWDSISPYTLVQVQASMTTLIMTAYFFCGRNIGFTASANLREHKSYFSKIPQTIVLNLVLVLLILYFVQSSGGLNNWLSNYSETFLTGRKGLGYVNVTIVALGSFSILLAGLRNFGRGGGVWGILPILPLILAIGFVGGFKSRLFVLILFFFLPYLVSLKINIGRIIAFTSGFFVVLYTVTIVRSQGYYAGTARFLELIPSYFNAFPLHDLIVTREAPNVLTTSHFSFTKIGQALGLVGPDAEYDISVMLTKEFFPDHWYIYSATQQWPLETELYLNYYGTIGQTLPLLIYGLWISFLFKVVFKRKNWTLYPIMALELVRIISTMRGVLIPWIFPVIVIQYCVIYGLGLIYFPKRKKENL